jgi:hypothetical protein
MKEKQALEMVKSALDLGVSKGNFKNLNETLAIVEAWNVIAKHFESQTDKDEDANGSN